MSTNIGYSTLQVIPSTKGFGAALSGQVNPQMGAAGAAGGKAYGGKMLASVKGFAAPIAGAFAAIKIVGLFKDSIQSASDLNESASKVGVVFGAASKQIMDASKTSALAMGLSKNAYLDASGTLGNLLVSLDIAPEKAANMSQAMVKLAGDMASFNNASPEETLLAIRSGLTGETEPLKRFGVNMNEATLKTMALSMGLITTTKEALTPQTKALAAQALIMDQTATAQGDFARTSTGLANQQRIAAAQVEDLKTKIGQGLLPITIKVTTAFNSFITGMMEGTGVGGQFKSVVVGMFNVVKPFVTFLVNNKDKVGLFMATVGGGILIFKGITAAIKASAAAGALYRGVMTSIMLANGGVALTSGLAAGGVRAFTVALLANPITAWAAGIAIAVAGLVKLYQWLHKSSGAKKELFTVIPSGLSGPTNIGNKMGPFPLPGHENDKPGGGGAGTGDSTKILDALNLKIAIEEQKQNLRGFSRFLNTDFIASLKDSGTKATDIIGKLVGGVDSLAKGFSATISDPAKQAGFNLASSKIVNALNNKLLGFESAFDAINTAREALKTKIADADSKLTEAIQLRSDAANSISNLLSKPFGQPSELVKALSGAEASADSIISGYDSMVKMVNDRFKSISGGKKDALLGFLKEQATSLIGLVAKRTQIANELEKSQTKLEDAIKMKAGYADNLSSGLKSAGLSLSEFYDKEKGAASPAGIISGFMARLNAIKSFSANLKSLAGKGLGKGLIDQIVGMGAAEGGALATSLMSATGEQIAALNATGDEISATADSLGAALSNQFYDQSIAQAQGIVKGWQDSQAGINAQMRAITSGIGAELAPLTDSMANLGMDSARALLDGFKSQDNALIAQAASLGARMAQAVADALAALRVASGGADFGVADAKAVAAKLAEEAAKLKAAEKAKADAKAKAEADAAANAQPNNLATSDDIMTMTKLLIASNKNTALLTQSLQRADGVPRGAVL